MSKKIKIMILRTFLFVLLFSFIKNDENWKCSHLDTALIRISISNELKSFLTNAKNARQNLQLLFQNYLCENCDLVELKSFSFDDNFPQLVEIDSYYLYAFQIYSLKNDSTSNNNRISVCDKFQHEYFKECGEYNLIVNDFNDCKIEARKEIDSSIFKHYFPICFGLIVFFSFVLICNLIEKKSAVAKFVDIEEKGSKNEQIGVKLRQKRLDSLDTFRGFCIFLMIFVNYGCGGYKFLQHAPWHGLNLADYVFPWFLWIMGFSIHLSIESALSIKNSNKLTILRKTVVRSLKMFLLGLWLNLRNGVEIQNLRIFGVMQRIALCYIFVAASELAFHSGSKRKKGRPPSFFNYILSLKADLTIVLLLVSVWYYFVFIFEPLDGCPKGYLGPGGLHDHSKFANCTGGTTGYIDRAIFGANRLYNWPTPKKVYRTSQAFDPEGLLSSLMALVTAYLGVQAGKVLCVYKDENYSNNNDKRALFLWLFWAVQCSCVYYMIFGSIPLNKNLWTISYAMITGSSAFILFSLFYLVVDLKQVWSGNPFIFLGKNSILIYACHVLFSKTMPVQFLVCGTHFSQFLNNLWGSIFWTLVSICFYSKRIFIQL